MPPITKEINYVVQMSPITDEIHYSNSSDTTNH